MLDKTDLKEKIINLSLNEGFDIYLNEGWGYLFGVRLIRVFSEEIYIFGEIDYMNSDNTGSISTYKNHQIDFLMTAIAEVTSGNEAKIMKMKEI
ncbi:hypothetical protein ACI2JA_03170 [Alkalihalobacillus sp. NPDC078783]